MQERNDAIAIYKAAVDAVQPACLLPEYIQFRNNELYISGRQIPLKNQQHIYIIGAGKAAAAMAQVTEQILGKIITEGFIVTKYNHALPLLIISHMEAAHPVPDENSLLAAERTKVILQKATEADIIICLLSGGASSLLESIPASISLQAIKQLFQQLLNSGANIAEMNTVRKHLSTIKGGQLLRYAPASTWFSFIISDVPGDNPEVIAGGPTTADTSTFEEAIQIIYKYKLQQKIPTSVIHHLENGRKGLLPETVKNGDPVLKNVQNIIIGSNAIALRAAVSKATELGYHTLIHESNLKEDAAIASRDFISLCKNYNGPLPACLLMGGETTVTVTGSGKGGRNQHFALAALLEMMKSKHDKNNNVTIMSAGTDGTDGPTDAAGAIIDKHSIDTVNQNNFNPQQFFDNNDSYHFFQQAGGLIKTGATQTNVMDIMLALIV